MPKSTPGFLIEEPGAATSGALRKLRHQARLTRAKLGARSYRFTLFRPGSAVPSRIGSNAREVGNQANLRTASASQRGPDPPQPPLPYGRSGTVRRTATRSQHPRRAPTPAPGGTLSRHGRVGVARTARRAVRRAGHGHSTPSLGVEIMYASSCRRWQPRLSSPILGRQVESPPTRLIGA